MKFAPHHEKTKWPTPWMTDAQMAARRARFPHDPGTAEDDWRPRAACRGYDDDLFFPRPKNRKQTVLAKQVCAGCPVMDECLSFALNTGQDHGVWGGLSEDERRELRRARQTA